MKKKLFAIIGSPIAHSLSPVLHNYWFEKYNIEAEYSLLDVREENLKNVIQKIKTEILLAYGVYQVEAEGLDLFEYIKGDRDSIMGLPIKQIMNYIEKYNK